MKNRIKLCLQVAWLTSVFVVLVMGFNFCAATDQACFEAGDRMFLTMAVLSFPAGILGAMVASCYLWPLDSVDQLNDYVTFWLTMAGAGYLQWFVIIPRMFAKPKITTLHLEATKTVAKVPAVEIPRPPRMRKRIRRILAYDKLGRTPLERAMSSTGLQMLPHEGRDLPRIDRFPGQLSSRVMAAGQPDDIEIDTALSHFIDHFT